jgi:hypothetical protein
MVFEPSRPQAVLLVEIIDNSAHQLDIVPILIGSQQTQHVELHKDDLDHVGQLTRSKHEAHGGGDDHLATVIDP